MLTKRFFLRTVLPVLLTVAAAILLTGTILLIGANRCVGVKVLSERGLERFTDYVYTDLHEKILLNGSPAAIDVETSTLYIPQTLSGSTLHTSLSGTLTCTAKDYKLYFAPDEAFETLSAAAESGHPFRLLLSADGKTYMQYSVIFTTLPILLLNGSADGVNEEGEEVYQGNLSLWEANTAAPQASSVEWHIRGWSTQLLDKKSWKLSLKDADGNNRDLSFLGLGSDDDWILNPLSFDDQKLREGLVASIWEEMNRDADYPLSMSSGEYVEAVINGKYHGLYLLQRRIDRKFLSLGGEDVLLKAKHDYSPETASDAYEVIYSARGEEYALGMAASYFETFTPEAICLSNWIDLEILLQLCCMPDNSSYKNMYYLWHQDTLYFLPWDVDMSFGITYKEGILYDASVAEELCRHRQEYDALKAYYPDLDSRIAARWQDLRQSRLTEEWLLSTVSQYRAPLLASGALARDNSVWGVFAGDTTEQLTVFIRTRLAFLDGYYGALA